MSTNTRDHLFHSVRRFEVSARVRSFLSSCSSRFSFPRSSHTGFNPLTGLKNPFIKNLKNFLRLVEVMLYRSTTSAHFVDKVVGVQLIKSCWMSVYNKSPPIFCVYILVCCKSVNLLVDIVILGYVYEY